MNDKEEPLPSAEEQRDGSRDSPEPSQAKYPRGRPFKKGQSGNPSGRPKDELGLRALARSHSTEAVEKLVEIMRSKKVSAVARVRAISELLDRGYGRPAQQIEAELKHDVPAVNPIETARRVWHLLYGQTAHLPDPSRALPHEAQAALPSSSLAVNPAPQPEAPVSDPSIAPTADDSDEWETA